MITTYSRQGNSTQVRQISDKSEFPSGVCFVDMLNPTEAEMALVQESLSIELPTQTEVWKNHVLNRFYNENGVLYMTAAVINKSLSQHPEVTAVTFILGKNYLLTVRGIEPTSFKNFASRLMKSASLFETSSNLAEGLFEEIIMRVAHNSEIVVDSLDDLSHRIFSSKSLKEDKSRNPSQLMKTVLKSLGETADLNSKINESLNSINRMLVFFKQTAMTVHPYKDPSIDLLIADCHALITQTAFLSDKITFQLDATLGMINVEQNLIIKIFSIVTVFFLPATLVSSIYGMNFAHMPELSWIWGYPFALFLMIMCAIVPHIYFKRKGWL